jgi:TolA-binding protein
MVDKISSDYVSKAEFEKEMKKIYSLLGASAAKSGAGKASGEKKEMQATARGAGSKDLASLFTKARKSFWQGRYSEAKELFMQTAQAGYKPAMSYFYIGESCYYSKEYACAIENYKKSASLNQNASYMPTLLLHSGISMERLGQKDGARKFYELVVRLYPDTKAAKIAKERLQKL